MDQTALIPEARMLYLHRVLLDQIVRTPEILDRAQAWLAKTRKTEDSPVLTQWADLLAQDYETARPIILEDTPAGGALRAQSPLLSCLAPEERNALWQRVGLQQFAAYFLSSAQELALSLEEQALAADVPASEVESWSQSPPLTMRRETLERLKRIVALRQLLENAFPSPKEGRAWLRAEEPSFGTTPLTLVLSGEFEPVRTTLMFKGTVASENVPSH